jgi:glycosyltransferase involved in cell wall biosynthesis
VYKGKKIAVVIPCFNEAKMISKTLKGIPAFVDFVYVIDDFSTDDTSTVALKYKRKNLKIHRLPENQGVGGAILAGHQFALDDGADISVVMAGDDQMDPAELPKLLNQIVDNGYGFSKANRFYSTKSFSGMPKYRIFGNVVLTFLTKVSSGYWHLFDPQNGYTAVSRESLELLDFSKISKRYDFENDMLIWLSINEVAATDVPIPARYRDEKSAISLRKTIPHLLRTLWNGFWKRIFLKYVLRSFSPIALLFFTGLLLLVLGIIGTILISVESVGLASATPSTVVLAVGPLFLGIQFLMQALILDIEQSPGFRNVRK